MILAVLATVAAHYGDPNDGGCEKDEQPVKINGLAETFARHLAAHPGLAQRMFRRE